MRLVHTTTLKLEEFGDEQRPKYSILSHRWGKYEVTLQDLENGNASAKAGYDKVLRCCKKAKQDGYEYTWIDTCCIDKTSSAELSEAINSMYQWYFYADRCYAYLADVPKLKSTVQESEWFERGFTLQELLAPAEVFFLDDEWNDIGTKNSLQEAVTERTGIPADILSGAAGIDTASIAQRMSWAAKRRTTRLEDRAYCLMGIFGVNMPLIYGEGERAFTRLQEEIIKVSEDQSIFAWKSSDVRTGLLATSPAAFAESQDIVPLPRLDAPAEPLDVTSRGVTMDVYFVGRGPQGVGLAILDCVHHDSENLRIGIYVRDLFWTMQNFERVISSRLEMVTLGLISTWQLSRRKISIQTKRITQSSRCPDEKSGTANERYKIYSDAELARYSLYANRTALCNATDAGSNDDTWLLLTRSDVDVNWSSVPHWTPLWRAVARGHETIAKMLLLQDGIGYNSLDHDQQTLLSLAVREGHHGVVELLLDKGANINTGDNAKRTPLWIAAALGRTHLVQKLLQKGADRETRDSHGRTPLFIACSAGHAEAVECLVLSDANANMTDSYGHTPLWEAAKSGHTKVVWTLLEKGNADINAKSAHGRTALSGAAANGHTAVVEVLLSHGANVRAKDAMGVTAVTRANDAGHRDLAKFMAEMSSDDGRERHGLKSFLQAVQGKARGRS